MTDRANAVAEQLAPYFSAGQQLLEIGAGQGLVAQALQQASGAQLTLVDVVDYNQTKLPLQTYDGLHLPFPDGAFDWSLLIFVLHHTPDPLPVLEEALRVAKAGTVIVENHVDGALRQWFTRTIDSLPHYRYGVPPCYRAQTSDSWHTHFQKLPVRAELLGRFTMNSGFWQNFIMRLNK